MNALLLLGLLVTADAKEAAKIEGTWVAVSVIADGKEKEEIKGDKLSFKDGALSHTKGEKTEGKGTYKLDPAAKPATIDFQEEGKDRVHKGIYRLDGDKLTVCIPADPDGKRPTEFSGKEGTGQMLIELKREKK